jgi:hypothetical protein
MQSYWNKRVQHHGGSQCRRQAWLCWAESMDSQEFITYLSFLCQKCDEYTRVVCNTAMGQCAKQQSHFILLHVSVHLWVSLTSQMPTSDGWLFVQTNWLVWGHHDKWSLTFYHAFFSFPSFAVVWLTKICKVYNMLFWCCDIHIHCEMTITIKFISVFISESCHFFIILYIIQY